MPIDAVVADANVLLSAVSGKAAMRVFTDFDLTIHATHFNLEEVERYLPRMARKYRLHLGFLRIGLGALPLVRHAESSYASTLAAARTDLDERDIDDAHALALARHLELPLWSNDHDLQDRGVPCLTTARLLAELEKT